MRVTLKHFSKIARVNMIAGISELCEIIKDGLSPVNEELITCYVADVICNLKTKLFGDEREADIDLDTLPKKMVKAVRKTEDNTPIMDAGIGWPLMFLATAIMTGHIVQGIIDDLKKEEESNGNS
jgi:hypothetical protein